MGWRTGILLIGIFLLTVGAGFGATTLRRDKATPITDKNHVVELKSDRAEPSAIAVTKGAYVQFNSKDGKSHNIGEGSGDDGIHQAEHQPEHAHDYQAKVSGAFGPDEGYRVLFNKTGTYEFHDHLNPKISVTVVVYEAKK